MDCAICQDSLHESPTHKLECGHEFHTNCILSWIRSGQKSCPLCRNETSSITNNMNYLKRLTKMKSCPTFIKDAFIDYEIIKKEVKDLKYEVEIIAEGIYLKVDLKSKKKKLKKKKSLLKNAKEYLCNCHVFILPIKKHFFT